MWISSAPPPPLCSLIRLRAGRDCAPGGTARWAGGREGGFGAGGCVGRAPTGPGVGSKSIYLVVDGELEVVRPPAEAGGRPAVLGALRAGHSVGEFGALIAARATAAVRAGPGGACVVAVPLEAVDAVAYGLPDVVDDVHEIKLIVARKSGRRPGPAGPPLNPRPGTSHPLPRH